MDFTVRSFQSLCTEPERCKVRLYSADDGIVYEGNLQDVPEFYINCDVNSFDAPGRTNTICLNIESLIPGF